MSGEAAAPQATKHSEGHVEEVKMPRDRPQSHTGTRPALKLPPWAIRDDGPATAREIKSEYMAMKTKEQEDKAFNRKMNIWRPVPQVTHMKKDWRYYINVGSAGNVWNDLYHTPDRRRPLVITPTVIRGFQTQEGVGARHDVKKAEQQEARVETVLFEREQRRWQVEERKAQSMALQAKAGQLRARKVNSARGGMSNSQAHGSGTAADGAGMGAAAAARTGGRPASAAVARTSEVPRPASAIVGKCFKPFEYTTLLTQDEWSKAVEQRQTTKEELRTNIERPDLQHWAAGMERKKAALEEEWVQRHAEVVQERRRERKIVEMARMEHRRELERLSGQSRVRDSLSRRQTQATRVALPQSRRGG